MNIEERKECTNCCHGYFVAMRKKPFVQFDRVWYEHKCTMCISRRNFLKKYSLIYNLTQ